MDYQLQDVALRRVLPHTLLIACTAPDTKGFPDRLSLGLDMAYALWQAIQMRAKSHKQARLCFYTTPGESTFPQGDDLRLIGDRAVEVSGQWASHNTQLALETPIDLELFYPLASVPFHWSQPPVITDELRFADLPPEQQLPHFADAQRDPEACACLLASTMGRFHGGFRFDYRRAQNRSPEYILCRWTGASRGLELYSVSSQLGDDKRKLYVDILTSLARHGCAGLLCRKGGAALMLSGVAKQLDLAAEWGELEDAKEWVHAALPLPRGLEWGLVRGRLALVDGRHASQEDEADRFFGRRYENIGDECVLEEEEEDSVDEDVKQELDAALEGIDDDDAEAAQLEAKLQADEDAEAAQEDAEIGTDVGGRRPTRRRVMAK